MNSFFIVDNIRAHGRNRQHKSKFLKASKTYIYIFANEEDNIVSKDIKEVLVLKNDYNQIPNLRKRNLLTCATVKLN